MPDTTGPVRLAPEDVANQRVTALFSIREIERIEKFRRSSDILLTKSAVCRMAVMHQIEVWERSNARKNAKQSAAAV